MKELVAKLLANTDGALMFIAISVICLNTLLTALKKIVDKVKDKTVTKLDDKASEVMGKVLRVVSKILEFASANSTVLPPKARAEIEQAAAEKAVETLTINSAPSEPKVG